MTILLAGANGQVGREISERASRFGLDVIGFDAQDMDITDLEAIRRQAAACQPKVIINAAAYTAVDKAESERDLAFAINCDGASNLARVSAERNIPLLHISTDYVFDGEKDGDYFESDVPNPVSVYGESKYAGELAVAGHCEQSVILRVSWVFGQYGHNFVKTMLRLGAERDELNVVNDQYGAPTPATSIADTLLGMAEKMIKRPDELTIDDWGLFHLPSDPGVTWYEFAAEILEQAEKVGVIEQKPKINPVGSEAYPMPVKRPRNSRLGTIRGTTAIEWRPELRRMLVKGN
ncbi:MAG: dTDP-4-dehydrorhamnose reductase [unclassified Hahellaceae]|nr:dTDP-4-dehydrorhamnose reductase [Hahellaceae bacterium]|tara:strand:+ start:19638 stop:20513 length:876 start_codon:yes stop_codon:yes gene_type:complete